MAHDPEDAAAQPSAARSAPSDSTQAEGNPQRSARALPEHAGQRLDWTAAQLFPEFSRSQLRRAIDAQKLRVDGAYKRASDALKGGELLSLAAAAMREEREPPAAQPLPLAVRHEDADLIVVDKQAGIAVHPGAGQPDSTLLNALLHRYPELGRLPRAGIVHRLDQHTSGLLAVARSERAHTSLTRQFQRRKTRREYQAVCCGALIGGGLIDAPIARNPRNRQKMAVVERGRPSLTRYWVERRFVAHTHVRLALDTGRAHQIRVHLASIGHPLVGDPLYGGRPRFPPDSDGHTRSVLGGFARQALHAALLGVTHPESGSFLEWRSPLPTDFCALLAALARDAENRRPPASD